MKKRLIAIDGLDASGKMTQTELLKDLLAEKGIPYRYLSFPTYDSDYSAHVNMYLSGRFGDDPEAVNPFAASSFFGADRFCSYMLDWKKDSETRRGHLPLPSARAFAKADRAPLCRDRGAEGYSRKQRKTS